MNSSPNIFEETGRGGDVVVVGEGHRKGFWVGGMVVGLVHCIVGFSGDK